MNTSIRNLLNQSIPLKVTPLLISLAKIVTTVTILAHTKERCSQPIDIWLITMTGHDLINMIYFGIELWFAIMIRRENERRNNVDQGLDENNDPFQENLDNLQRRVLPNQNGYEHRRFTCSCLDWTKNLNRVFFVGIFIWGHAILFFTKSDCAEVTPAFTTLALIYIIFGYFYLFYPFLILLLICLCLPFMVIIALNLARGQNRALDKDLISKLPVTKYDRRSMEQVLSEENDNDCIICRVDYSDGDPIIQLPCNKKHFFHEDCIKRWLKVNGLCPVCRKAVEV